MSNVLLDVRNVRKTYVSGRVKVPALRGVSFSIYRGDFLMITGHNGSGKSTFMHQVAMLDYPTKGEIMLNLEDEIDGTIDVTKLPEKRRSVLRLKEVGYIFQEYALIRELTALENVMLPRLMYNSSRDAKARALEVLDTVDLADKANRLPSELSGGEQQRVAIARALVNNPHIIFADEPTANLDTVASEKVLETFKKINQQGMTIVAISHEPDELAYAKRQIVFENGLLKEERQPKKGELL